MNQNNFKNNIVHFVILLLMLGVLSCHNKWVEYKLFRYGPNGYQPTSVSPKPADIPKLVEIFVHYEVPYKVQGEKILVSREAWDDRDLMSTCAMSYIIDQ